MSENSVPGERKTTSSSIINELRDHSAQEERENKGKELDRSLIWPFVFGPIEMVGYIGGA